VLVYSDDVFSFSVTKSLEDIQKENENKVEFTLFNVTPISLNTIKSYPKSLIINNDSKQAGVLQGKIIADLWNIDREAIDKNRDNILQ
jgi:methyl-galactoside transport system substrate-binding protein